MTFTARRIVAVATAALAVAPGALLAALPAAGDAPRPARLTGDARITYAPSPADVVRFAFDVSGTGRGTLRVSHHVAALGQTWWAEARADCLRTSGRVAVVTGVVERTSPELAGWAGKHLGFTVVDGEPDQVGTTGPQPALAPCLADGPGPGGAPVLAPAPLDLVRSGGYRVRAASQRR